MLIRFEIQTVTENEIVGAFALRQPALARVVAKADGDEKGYESIECERIGRVFIENLQPDTQYTVSFLADDKELNVCTVKTLPAPQGAKLAEFAVVADPHVTTKREMRHGRLFLESGAILRQTVAEINKRDTDFVLIPGDVSNDGVPDEVALAAEILAELKCPLLLVAGDHDMHHGRRHIYDTFGPGQWVEHRNGFTIIGCDLLDMGDGKVKDRMGFWLGQKGVDHILSALESADGTVILLCHRQLVPDDYIVDANRVFGDHQLFEEKVLPKLPTGTIAYVGHKNVAARFQRGNLAQLNCPQTVQYPCGILRVRCYANGMYHSYVPIFSELLNDISRALSNELDNPNWEEGYRRGRGYGVWNFVHRPEKPSCK